MKVKKLVLLLTVLLLTASLIACSNGNTNNAQDSGSKAAPGNSSSNTSDKVQEPVELRIAWWGGDARHQMYNAILDNFEKEYPHITVLREFTDWGPYWEKLATQTAGGNAP